MNIPPGAVTLDYWDTIYDGAVSPARRERRQAALRRMLDRIGHPVPAPEFELLYRASAEEAERWWRDGQRGYSAMDRIRWILERLGLEFPDEAEPVAEAVREVDDVLLDSPPPLFPGAAEAIHALAARFPLAIISDTGFASGTAQDRLLERDGLRDCFQATVYSMAIGHAKPRPEPFLAAIAVLRCEPGQVIHVGDNERTDVAGALDAGMRAVRADMVSDGGESRAERVVRTLPDLADYLLGA